MREKDLLAQIKDYLNIRGIFWWRNHQSLGSQKGIPDLMCLYQGKFYAFELKGMRGKLSWEQKWFLDEINKNGGIAKEVRNLEEIMDLLC